MNTPSQLIDLKRKIGLKEYGIWSNELALKKVNNPKLLKSKETKGEYRAQQISTREKQSLNKSHPK